MNWSKLSFLSFFRKSPKQLVVAKSNTENEIKAEKMVLLSVVRQSVAKRIPLIKFRRQRQDEAALHANVATGSANHTSGSASVSGVGATSLPTIEDWQLPNRYRRKPLDQLEIDYINRGGPA